MPEVALRDRNLTRANKDPSILEGGRNLSTAPLQPGGTATVEPAARLDRPARKAPFEMGYGRISLKRPGHLAKQGQDLPKTVEVSLVKMREIAAPPTDGNSKMCESVSAFAGMTGFFGANDYAARCVCGAEDGLLRRPAAAGLLAMTRYGLAANFGHIRPLSKPCIA